MMLNRWIRRVAGIDEGMMKDVPRYDRVWATHIGYMLILTFIILFGIVYMSIGYFGASKIVFDASTNTLLLHANDKTTMDTITSIVIALVIASMIFMFDRAIYQSDWFAQVPYKIEMKNGERVIIFLNKFWRVLVRLSISLGLAFALSTFVELYIYESQLLDTMQKEHLKENKIAYNDIKQFSIHQEIELKATLENIHNIETSIEAYQNGRIPNKDKQVSQEIQKKEISLLDDTFQKKEQNIKREEEKELMPLQNKLKKLIEEREKEQEIYNQKEIQMMSEDAGVKSSKLYGIDMTGTGKTGCGKICKIHKKFMEQSEKKVTAIQKEINILESDIFLLESKYYKILGDLENTYKSQKQESIQNYKNKQIEVKELQLKNLQKNQDKLMLKLQEEKINYQYLKVNKEKLLAEYTQKVTNSPSFIRFRDGPVTRLMALDKLYEDKNHGDKMYEFSIIIKIFLMFLEILPVLVKVLFSPPSVYAVILQQQVMQGARRAYEGNMESLDDIERQIEREERQKVLDELRAKRGFESNRRNEYKGQS